MNTSKDHIAIGRSVDEHELIFPVEYNIDSPETAINQAQRDLDYLKQEHDEGLRQIRSAAKSAGISDEELDEYLRQSGVLEQAKTIVGKGQNSFSRMKRGIKRALAFGMLLMSLGQASYVKAEIKTSSASGNNTKINQQISENIHVSNILNSALINTNTKQLIHSNEYTKADTPEELEALYYKSNDEDANIGDELAVAAKYNDFLAQKRPEELAAEYGKERAVKIYQQAGYITGRSFENYFAFESEKGEIMEVEKYIDGFESSSKYYRTALRLSENLLVNGKYSKTIQGIIRMNDQINEIANKILVYGEPGEKIVAAKMRRIMGENIRCMGTRFKELHPDIDYFSLDRGRVVFPDSNKLSDVLWNRIVHSAGEKNARSVTDSWKRMQTGGIVAFTQEYATYLSQEARKGSLSRNNQMLADLLINNGAIIQIGNHFIPNPEISILLLSSSDIDAYTHENQHYSLIENEELQQYWIAQWNTKSSEFKRNFLKNLFIVPESQIETLATRKFTVEEITRSIKDQVQGKEVNSLSYEVFQEFFAYSTDNVSEVRIYDNVHELS